MKSKTFSSLSRQIQDLDAQIAEVISEILTDQPLLIGSISEVLRTCGNPTCHCAQKPSHPSLVLMTSHQGKRRCQVVRKADIDEVSLLVQRYRQFRSALKKLKALEATRQQLLRSLMEAKNRPYS